MLLIGYQYKELYGYFHKHIAYMAIFGGKHVIVDNRVTLHQSWGFNTWGYYELNMSPANIPICSFLTSKFFQTIDYIHQRRACLKKITAIDNCIYNAWRA